MGSIFIPISLFMFGWSARASVHWSVSSVFINSYLSWLTCVRGGARQDRPYHRSCAIPSRNLPHIPIAHDVPVALVSPVYWIRSGWQQSFPVSAIWLTFFERRLKRLINCDCSSCMASVFPIFGTAFFRNLGLGPGCSLLAGISIALMFVFYVSRQTFCACWLSMLLIIHGVFFQLLVRYGDKLRARSRYAD
jgi:hypothetical protein